MLERFHQSSIDFNHIDDDFSGPYTGETSGWDRMGCEKVWSRSDDVITTCQCDHMTNFALLLDISQKGLNDEVLSYITFVGCAISFVGLLLTVVIHMSLRSVPSCLSRELKG